MYTAKRTEEKDLRTRGNTTRARALGPESGLSSDKSKVNEEEPSPHCGLPPPSCSSSTKSRQSHMFKASAGRWLAMLQYCIVVPIGMWLAVQFCGAIGAPAGPLSSSTGFPRPPAHLNGRSFIYSLMNIFPMTTCAALQPTDTGFSSPSSPGTSRHIKVSWFTGK